MAGGARPKRFQSARSLGPGASVGRGLKTGLGRRKISILILASSLVMVGSTLAAGAIAATFSEAGSRTDPQLESFASTWAQLAPTGVPPTARYAHTAVYDAADDRMVVFGGVDAAYKKDVWVLANASGLDGTPAWIQLAPAGGAPTARYGHTAVYDAANDLMMVFGGYDGWYKNDVWVLTNASGLGGIPTWTQLAPTNAPPTPRYLHVAVYDPADNRMVVFGGVDGVLKNDVWLLRNANGLGATPMWTQLAPSGGPPAERYLHTAVYDPTNNRMVVFGGDSAGGLKNDVWALMNADGSGLPTWLLLAPTGAPPSARYGHTAVYDPAGNRVVAFGGRDTGGFRNDTWTLTNANGLGGTPAWTQIAPTGGPPTARSSHAAVYDPAGNRMVAFGGDDGTPSNDAWVLSEANGLPIPSVPGLHIIAGLISLLFACAVRSFPVAKRSLESLVRLPSRAMRQLGLGGSARESLDRG